MASRFLWSTVFGDVFSNLNYLLMKILNVFYDLLSLLMSSLIYVIWWSSVLGDILSNLCYLLKNILTSCLLWSTAIFVNLWSTVYGDFFSTIRFLFKKKTWPVVFYDLLSLVMMKPGCRLYSSEQFSEEHNFKSTFLRAAAEILQTWFN